MGRGVKKIKMTSGKYYPDSSTSLTKQVTIQPNQFVGFDVIEWLDRTTDEDKKKELTWMRQSNDRKTIIAQIKSSRGYRLKLSKKLCGPYTYYVEASLSGKRDFTNSAGVYVNGYCKPIIKATNWRKKPNGGNIKNKKPISYGDIVYIWIDTEGLNGNTITIEVYNQVGFFKTDKKIASYNVFVKDGEALYKIGDTSRWMSKVNDIQKEEQFYIKAKLGRTYLKDHLGDDKHAVYLNVKKELVSNAVKASENITPTKIHKPEVNTERYEPCKFDEVNITIPTFKDGKAVTDAVSVFKHGVTKLVSRKGSVEHINRTIHFDWNDYSITPSAQKTLNNILGFLLEHKGTTIRMSGYACVIGKKDYNQKLSQKRSDAVKDFFVSGGLNKDRIISVGRGEYNIQSPDDYNKRNEKEYRDARRVDISFSFLGHAANAIVFETIASRTEKDVTLDVIGFNTDDCYRDKNKHKKEIIIKSPDVPVFTNSGTSIKFPVKSAISPLNVFPIQYIWPKINALTRSSSAAVYNVHLHSCRYYTLSKNPIIKINAYPDIKWRFQLSFNYTHPIAYTHANLPEYSRKHPLNKEVQIIKRDMRNAQSKAVGAGKETKRVKNSSEMLSKFGLKLEADWNLEPKGWQQNTEITFDFAKKIRKVINVMVKYKEIADKVKNSVGGKAKGFNPKLPFMFEVQSPSLNGNIEWYLEQGKGKNQLKVANVGLIKLKAEPLIGANFIIDLLAIGSKMHPFVAAMIKGVEIGLSLLKGGMTFELIFRGELKFDFKALEFNSISGVKGGDLDLGAELGVRLILEIQFKVKYDTWFKEVDLELRAKAKADAYFEGKAKIDSDEKGVFFQPELGFSGLIFTFKAEIVVGGFKRTLKFGNKEDPFLKGEISKPDKLYIIE